MKIHIKSLFKNLNLALVLIIGGTVGLNAQTNLINNPGFELGGSGTGFTSTGPTCSYTQVAATGTSASAQCAWTTDPKLMNSSFISGEDHTPGPGNKMMVFDATTGFFYRPNPTGGPLPGFVKGKSYVFSYWIKTVSPAATEDNPSTRANISIFFNAGNVIYLNPSATNQIAPLPSEGWQQRSYSFIYNGNDGNLFMGLRTLNNPTVGNDFAVDDFSIVEGELPFKGESSSVNPTCPTATDGSIVVSLTGGLLPYTEYVLTGPGGQTQSNTTGSFSNLGVGVYSVSVQDQHGQTYNPTIELKVLNDMIITGGTTPICAGQSTTLSVTGGGSTYNWTATPPDPSITDPTSATQIVSPLVTTTYTVKSGEASNPTNLIYNGDFSLGYSDTPDNNEFSSGFLSDYQYYPFPLPTDSVQGSFTVDLDPNQWFAPFTSFGDHTTGDGYMLMADGDTHDPVLGPYYIWYNDASIPTNEHPINVEPNKNYTFSFYIANIESTGATPASFETTINGVKLGSAVAAPSSPGAWKKVTYNWFSESNTTASIYIKDIVTDGFGNDFAIDDISLIEEKTCAYEKSVTVTISSGIVPTFDPITPICTGDPLNPLPPTSLEGITGTWEPPLDNTVTTEYTFTPDAGQCASPAKLTITVNQKAIPTFNPVTPVCNGETLAPLSTISNEGITGTWAPPLDNTATTEYTFTPDAGQCATTAKLTITINQKITPTFNAVTTACNGDTLAPLPTTSNEGFTGTWTPPLNNTATTEYTFTPDAGQCSLTATHTITINPLPVVSTTQGCVGLNYTLTAVQPTSEGTGYNWFDASNSLIGTGASVVVTTAQEYRLVVTQNGCSTEERIPVTSPFCSIQKGISPNGDGLNDELDLSGYNVSKLKIFNRYGIITYEKSNYQNEWHGQSDSNNELPDGTYYYVIDFPDTKSLTGWIYINREK